MVVNAKKTKLPPAARNNPYSSATQDELDASLLRVDEELSRMALDDEAKRNKVLKERRQILEGYLWLMVRDGKATWSGGKPRGSKHPVKLTPGPSISDMIHEMRR